jgi:hypothetical protein
MTRRRYGRPLVAVGAMPNPAMRLCEFIVEFLPCSLPAEGSYV